MSANIVGVGPCGTSSTAEHCPGCDITHDVEWRYPGKDRWQWWSQGTPECHIIRWFGIELAARFLAGEVITTDRPMAREWRRA